MPSQILFFDQPRSGSHMLLRMLTEHQTNVKVLERLFSESRGPQITWLQSENYANGVDPQVREKWSQGIEKGLLEWRDAKQEVKANGHSLLIFCHAFFPVAPEIILHYLDSISSPKPASENFTAIPDELLLTADTKLLLSIRDPRLAVPSAYRTMAKMSLASGGGRPNYLVTTNLIWSRVMYDYFHAQGRETYAVDFDSLADPAYVRALSAKLGLDPANVASTWAVATREEVDNTHPMYYASQSTLIESSGFMRGKMAKGVDFAEEEREWQDEFADDAALVKEMVELTMPHYQYLYERRWQM
ncbi:hypothetical protein B0A48_14470 [Cryoendolithus antarcticus]|uniref:Sulfotransferase domain-containing protein n=1 Tax=Cryoendolithus antarcticus TaxID=1507870 RepID=A0A1V8SL90_9PEZI|nr:hypothetical protein B0A48_14470 [Cryoendolithus antarcticus]